MNIYFEILWVLMGFALGAIFMFCALGGFIQRYYIYKGYLPHDFLDHVTLEKGAYKWKSEKTGLEVIKGGRID